MDFKIKQPGDVGVLTIGDSLTIENAAEFKDALLNLFAKADDLVLDFQNVTEVDLSCLQLICAARNMAARLKKRLSVSDGPAGILQKAASEAGYARLLDFRLQYPGPHDDGTAGGTECP